MKLQLVGKMAGEPDYNYPLFHDAAKLLRGAGHEVFNPAEISDDTSLPPSYFMRACIGALLQAEVVVVLEGWERSYNAETEVRVAKSLALPVITLDLALSTEPQDPFYDYAMSGLPDD